jgi:hypothetical protein
MLSKLKKLNVVKRLTLRQKNKKMKVTIDGQAIEVEPEQHLKQHV